MNRTGIFAIKLKVRGTERERQREREYEREEERARARAREREREREARKMQRNNARDADPSKKARCNQGTQDPPIGGGVEVRP